MRSFKFSKEKKRVNAIKYQKRQNVSLCLLVVYLLLPCLQGVRFHYKRGYIGKVTGLNLYQNMRDTVKKIKVF